MPARCSQWPTKLAQFIAARRAQPFDWATQNCCFFACDWILELTGHDPAANFRPQVTSAATAARVLKRRGGVDAIAQKACAEVGWPECAPALARRGDVVEMQTEQGPALGVCLGARSAFAGPAGLEYRETLLALRAWRIA